MNPKKEITMRYYKPNAESFLSTNHGKLDITMMTSGSVITLMKLLRSIVRFLPKEQRSEVTKVVNYSADCKVATFKRADKSRGRA